MPGVGRLMDRLLMKAHRVRKRGLEQVVIARDEPAKKIRERVALRAAQVVQCADVAPADEERLERPDGPERDEREKGVVLADHALLTPRFQLDVGAEET